MIRYVDLLPAITPIGFNDTSLGDLWDKCSIPLTPIKRVPIAYVVVKSQPSIR